MHIEGNDLSLVWWNHRPALLRAALERFGGRADWKPRWHILAVPTEAFMGSARSVFSLAAPDERRECGVWSSANDPAWQGRIREAKKRVAEHEARRSGEDPQDDHR